MNNDITISTVLLNWNRIDNLKRTVKSYLATINVDYELFIVDNNSQDGSKALIQDICEGYPNHHAILLNENIGGQALNIGAEKATGKYIHFSENDIEYLPGWYENLLEKFDNFPELGQLSPFSPNPQKVIGEIFSVKETGPVTRKGITIYVTGLNTGTTSIIRRQVWDTGARWKSYGKGDIWFPDDASFSDEVRNRGFIVAYNDKYVIINWGHNIRELKKELPYYIENYKSKVWFGIDGFKDRLNEHGYDLVTNSAGSYEIVSCNVIANVNGPRMDEDNQNTGLACGSQQLWDDPNKYAQPAGITEYGHSIDVRGYQSYLITDFSISASGDDVYLRRKKDLLDLFFSVGNLHGRNLLDLGANAGFFCFWAVQKGITKATALDMDPQYLDIMQKIKNKLNIQNVEIIRANIDSWNEPADITLALALIHWVYSCTAVFGNISSIIEKLAQLTNYVCIIEWVEPDDPAIEFFHHTSWNKEYITGPYNIEEFQKAVNTYFKRCEFVGYISATRKLFMAFKTLNIINYHCPWPELMERSKIISSNKLTTCNGIDYWSSVYDDGSYIYKQATLDLAGRESVFLNQFDCAYFPHVYETKSEQGYSVIKLERIQGNSLYENIDEITGSADKLYEFIRHCIMILKLLEGKGISHRDIRMENIMIRDGKPVLLDFGWAVSEDSPYYSPDGLGDKGRLPDRGFSDIYAMGKLLQAVNKNKYAIFDQVIELMAEPDSSMRITDLVLLELLFKLVHENYHDMHLDRLN
ncbi:MAG: glycosyltransferase [Dehalococcoidia bacterium]|jgi:glycosyltransferase involved in cell wall biosynthesis